MQNEHYFEYHAPTAEQRAVLEALNEAWKDLYTQIILTIPNNRERSTAIQYLRTARMWGNAAVVLDGLEGTGGS